MLKQLEGDLIARAKASPTVTEALKARHASEKASQRTADNFVQWQQNFIDQVAASWLLSCVFVRTLEDRDLLNHRRIAGPGASDSQKLFFQMAPSLTERDYLLTVFRELTHFEAARDLFDAKHNPVWLLAPSAEAAKALLSLFRTPSSDTPAFRFGQPDTRFLGDLYQDLNERVRKRYALLQTPRFVESFILDRTLERAIERFGLDDTTVIDPTCGSGHFLLGSFDRLYEHRLRAEPGLDPRQAAHKALDAVFGADINPYAVGIARFRLTLSFLEKASFKKLADAPQLPLHLVVADSLLHNPHLEQASFADMEDQSIREWKGQEFALEDERAARDVLHRNYAAVVGNPPYIRANDKVLRDRYRELYQSCYREYSLAVPFTERFFQLGRKCAYVGMITANSFMKREFGKKLIEEYLPTINLDIIINTSGAYIPGHGTPTVLLFGTAEEPQGNNVLTVLASRGEPSTPKDPEQGQVWRSISDHWSDEGFENDYITVDRVGRDSLRQHPWSLAGGGAVELKALLENRRAVTLSEVADEIGFVCMTRADDIYFVPRDALRRAGIKEPHIVENVEGEVVRDWAISTPNTALFPYDDDLSPTEDEFVHRFLWPYRTLLWLRREPNGNHREIGLTWWEWSRFQRERYRAPLKIAFAFIATHNHFVLDRGGKVFKQSAPIIKLPEDATEDDHLALLGYLNSSTACFLLKQVAQVKQMTAHDSVRITELAKVPREFSGTNVSGIPLPSAYASSRERLLAFGRKLDSLGEEYNANSPALVVPSSASSSAELEVLLAESKRCQEALRAQQVAVQEELDWLVYGIFELTDETTELAATPVEPGERPFERYHGEEKAVATTIDGFAIPKTDPAPVARRRMKLIRENKELRLLETPDFKRRWVGSQGKFNRLAKTYEEAFEDAVAGRLALAVESTIQPGVLTTSRTAAGKLDETARAYKTFLENRDNPMSSIERLMSRQSVPFIAAWRYSDGGLKKCEVWNQTWDLQRREDAGESVPDIPVPPKYTNKDFRDQDYWPLRGKLDVPKERFISYPGCASDEDGEPLYGWAGWNHSERMQALAVIYQQRKKGGWRADRKPLRLARKTID